MVLWVLAALCVWYLYTLVIWPYLQALIFWAQGVPIAWPMYPIVGSVPLIRKLEKEHKHALYYCKEFHQTYGTEYVFSLGHFVRLAITDPEVVKRLLAQTSTSRTRLAALMLGFLGKNSLLLLETWDPHHAQARRVFGQAFHADRLRLALGGMGRATMDILNGWLRGGGQKGAPQQLVQLSDEAAASVKKAQEALDKEGNPSNGRVLSIPAEMQVLTLTVLLRTIFGSGGEGTGTGTDGAASTSAGEAPAGEDTVLLAGHQVIELTRQLMRAEGRLARLLLALPEPLPVVTLMDYLPLPGPLRRRRITREVNELLDGIVTATTQQQQQQEGSANDKNASSSIMGLALALAEKEKKAAAATDGNKNADVAFRGKLRDQALTFLMAGHETTAMLLTWALYLLAKHPEWQERVREEVLAVCGKPQPPQQQQQPTPPPTLSMEQLDRLLLLRCVLFETLRLYPPAPLLARQAGRKGLKVRPGLWLLPGMCASIDIYGIHTSERYWENASEFRPECWKKYLADSSGGGGGATGMPRFGDDRHSHTFLPFGAGPRTCIGRGFSLLEAHVVAAELLRRFRFAEPPGGTDVVPRHAITLNPRDGVLPLVVTRLE